MESLQEVEEALTTFCQSETMTDRAYLDKFRGVIKHYKHHLGQRSMQMMRVQDQLGLLLITAPTNKETREMESRANQECVLIHSSDPKLCAGLVMDFTNDMHGSDQYPTLMMKAYDMLINYCSMKQARWLDCHDHRGAYYSEGDTTP